MKPYTYVCTKCGSDAVSLEGFVNWNAEKQDYEVSDLCDDGHSCGVCEGECDIEKLELFDTPFEALDALEGWASTFIEDWLSDEGMDGESRKEANNADVRMRAAMAMLKNAINPKVDTRKILGLPA